MLQGLVTFAFDGVAAQIINSWRACRLHCLPPSFSLFTSLFPSFSYPPTPAPLAHLCLPNESVWLAVCCCQGAGEGDYSCRTGPGSAWADNRKEGLLEDSTKATAAPFSFSLFLFFCFYLFFLHRIATFKVEREGTRPDTDIVNLLSRWVTMMVQHLCYISVPEKSMCLWVCFRVCTNDCFLCCK